MPQAVKARVPMCGQQRRDAGQQRLVNLDP